jgi:hypothetical protein
LLPPARFVRPYETEQVIAAEQVIAPAGRVHIDSPRQTTFWLLPALLRDRKGDVVLLDAGVEDLVVKERGRRRLEKYASSLLLAIVPYAESWA